MKLAIKATQITNGGGYTHLRNLLERVPPWLTKENIVLHCSTKQEHMFAPFDAVLTLRTHSMPSRGLLLRVLWEQLVLPIILWWDKTSVLFEPGNTGVLFAPCKKVILIHNLAPFDKQYIQTEVFAQRVRLRILRFVTTHSIRRSNGVIYLSKFAKRLLAPIIGPTKGRSTVIYHGGLSTIAPALSIQSAQERPCKVILCVSHIYRYKNIETVVRALIDLRKSYKETVRLEIAGEAHDKLYRWELESLAHQGGVGDALVFLGSLSDEELSRRYKSCDVFVFPSLLENCPTILIEALSAGAPTICSDCGVMPEIARNGAAYFPPRDSEKLAQMLHLYLSDGEAGNGLRRAGLARSAHFDWATTAKDTFEFVGHTEHGSAIVPPAIPAERTI